MVERKGNVSLEARTAAFFEQDVKTIGDRIVDDGGMVIATLGTRRKVQVTEVEVFNRRDIGKRYKSMNGMEAGVLWNPPSRAIAQSLIVAMEKQKPGACVRILRANFYNPRTDTFVPTLRVRGKKFSQREGSVAEYLGLRKYDKSALRFLDASNVLYVGTQEPEENVTERANRELNKLMGGSAK